MSIKLSSTKLPLSRDTHKKTKQNLTFSVNTGDTSLLSVNDGGTPCISLATSHTSFHITPARKNAGQPRYLLLVQPGFAVVFPGGQRVPVGVPVEGEQAHGEAERVQDLVLDRGQEHLEFLRLGADALRAQVSVARDRPVQRRLLLAVGRVRHGQALVAPFRLHRAHVEHEIRALDAHARFRRSRAAVHTRRVARLASLHALSEEKKTNAG